MELAGRGRREKSLGGNTKRVSGRVRQKPHHAKVMKGDMYTVLDAGISAESLRWEKYWKALPEFLGIN